jgi:hypothetical protein
LIQAILHDGSFEDLILQNAVAYMSLLKLSEPQADKAELR